MSLLNIWLIHQYYDNEEISAKYHKVDKHQISKIEHVLRNEMLRLELFTKVVHSKQLVNSLLLQKGIYCLEVHLESGVPAERLILVGALIKEEA